MGIVRFDQHKTLQTDVEIALTAIAERHGLTVSINLPFMQRDQFSAKVTFRTINDASAELAERRKFAEACSAFGLSPDAYNAEFIVRCETYRLVGLAQRARFPIEARSVRTGEEVLFSDLMISDIRSRFPKK